MSLFLLVILSWSLAISLILGSCLGARFGWATNFTWRFMAGFAHHRWRRFDACWSGLPELLHRRLDTGGTLRRGHGHGRFVAAEAAILGTCIDRLGPVLR